MARTASQGSSGEESSTQDTKQNVERLSKILLSTPWGSPQTIINAKSEGLVVQERTRLHETYIKGQVRIKIFGFGISAIMFIISAIIIVFSPPDRTIIAYALGGVLVIAAAGVAGFTVLQMKA